MSEVTVDLTDLCPKCLGDGRCDEHTADVQRKTQREAARRRRKAAKAAEIGNDGDNKKKAPATGRRSPKANGKAANGHK